MSARSIRRAAVGAPIAANAVAAGVALGRPYPTQEVPSASTGYGRRDLAARAP